MLTATSRACMHACEYACVRACTSRSYARDLAISRIGFVSYLAYLCVYARVRARHCLGRNDREVGQPLECLTCLRCVSTESRFLFSRRTTRLFRWNSNAPRLASRSFSPFLSPPLLLLCRSSILSRVFPPRSPFIFNRRRDLSQEIDRLGVQYTPDTECTMDRAL